MKVLEQILARTTATRVLVRTILLVMSLVLVTASAVIAQTPKPKVLAWYITAAQNGTLKDIQSKLMSTGQFSQVDTFQEFISVPETSVPDPGPPTLAQLQQYDAVMLSFRNVLQFLTGYVNWPVVVGNLLAQYVDNGGAIVLTDWFNDVNTSTFYSSTSPYQVMTWSGGSTSASVQLGTVALPTHPIMNGVVSMSLPSSGLLSSHMTTLTLAPGAYLIASWNTSNIPMIAAREGVGLQGSRRVDLNFIPVSTDVTPNSGYYDPTTNGALIMANSLVWAGQKQYDVSVDTIVNPTNQSIKSIATSLIPTVQITDQGYTTPTAVTVRFQITPQYSGTPVYTHDTVISSANLPASVIVPGHSFNSAILHFPAFTPTAYGVYEDSVFVLNMSPVADQKARNNITATEFTVSEPNNIRTIAFVDPLPNSYVSAGIPTPIIIDFKNTGGNDQANVPVTAVIKDQTGAVVYRDTEYALNWLSAQVREVTFKNFTLQIAGSYTFYGIALMPTDQVRSDDTVTALVHVRFDYDAAAIGIVNPKDTEQKPYMLAWQPTVLFQSHGAQDLFNVPVRVQIRRCSDGALIFQADSNVIALNTDQNQQQFSFPSQQGVYGISQIPPGCYTMCAITLLPNDADRSNDTICTQFSVIDRLKGDYFVGAGQQFSSLHAAVDSMRFRGIGANVRLILTDNNYTENGTDSAATKFGALDFRGIRGLADIATVTWIPNAGVQPHITFTGNKPFCFYFGDLSGGHVTFEGYNPAGAPIPDQLVAEPNKRGITIVNNLTAAGAVFAFEEGTSNITLKDLVLKSNGLFTKDSDAVVRIYNEQSRNLYLGTGAPNPIRDTVAIHNIRIENCELGNAKYGVWDHALHTQFNIGSSAFVDWRNYNNVFTRNTIGTSASPLAYTGIQFNNEQNLIISHNEVSNIIGSVGGFPNVYGIDQPSVLQSDTGDVVGAWIDANRVHNLSAPGTAYGIAFQQAATIYSVGSGSSVIRSMLPVVTSNRTTNNMIFDLRGSTANYPLTYTTSSATYSTDRDSIFNNSISTNNATINIFMAQSKHTFLWNNIIQNTGTGPYTNYSLQLPRPFTNAVSSDYNLFDLRGTNTFATVNEYDLVSGTLIQSRTFRRLNDWRTYTQQDLHSLAGDPLFASDSLHEPTALSYVESPASNNGAWLNTATQLHDFDGDLRLQGNQTPDIGADEFEGFQYSNDLVTLSITTPAGYSATSDTTSVTIENPLWVTAQVTNLSSQAVFNVPVSALVEVAISGGPWTTIFSGTTTPMNFEVNETKSVTFRGPTITQAQAQTGVFRVTVTVPNDQNNANNAAQKVFRVLLKNNATLVSYTSASPFGLRNRDSVTAALRRLSIAYDTIDRSIYGTTDIDYSPWWTLVWSGDSTRVLDSIPLYIARVNNYVPTSFNATWTDISTTGIAIPIPSGSLDDGAVSFLLPFSLQYDSTVVPANSTVQIGSNGAISFANGTAPASNAVGNSTYPGMVCLFSADMYDDGPNNYYQVDGLQPNRVLTIEYPSIHQYPPTGTPVTAFQVKFYETSGQIEFIYRDPNLNMGRAGGIGLNGFSATSTPSEPSFVS